MDPGDFTIGVEEEFHVLDAESGQLRADITDVLDEIAAPLADNVEPELLRTMVETQTAVCATLREVRSELVRLRGALVSTAAGAGGRIAACGSWPAATPPVPPTEKARYEEIVDRFGLTAREQTVCGCHVHVHVADPDLRVAVIRRARPWLPALLALSANSPFWRGADTGYASYRSQVWTRWPTAGNPPTLRTAGEYDRLVATLLATGVMRDEGMLYWDIRVSRRFDTVEFRVADACLRIDEALLLAALFRALTQTCVRLEQSARPAEDTGPELLRAATWQAARYGLTADLIDPATLLPVPASEVVRRLIEQVRPALDEHGDAQFVDDSVRRILAGGTGAARQRAAFERTGRIADVVQFVADETEATD